MARKRIKKAAVKKSPKASSSKLSKLPVGLQNYLKNKKSKTK